MLKILKLVFCIFRLVSNLRDKTRVRAIYMDSDRIVGVEFWRF